MHAFPENYETHFCQKKKMHARNGMSDFNTPAPIKKSRVEEESPAVCQFLLSFIQNSSVKDLTNHLEFMEKPAEILKHKQLRAAVEEKIGPIANFALAHVNQQEWFSYVVDTMDVNEVVDDPKVNPAALFDYLLKKDTVPIMHVRKLFARGLDIKNNSLFANVLFRDTVVDDSVLTDLLIKNGADIFKVAVDASGNNDVCAFAAYRRGAQATLLVILNVAAAEASKTGARRFVVNVKRKKSDKVDEVMVVDWLLEKREEKTTDTVFASEYFKKIRMTYAPATVFHAPDSDYGILHKWILRGDPYFLKIFMEKNRPLLEEELKFDFSSKNKGYTALHIAACYPDDAKILNMVLTLMDSCRGLSPDVDVKGPLPNGFTPLYLAAMHGKVKMVRLLLDKGANLANIPANRAYPPILNIATINGHIEVVDAILERCSTSEGLKIQDSPDSPESSKISNSPKSPFDAVYRRDTNGFFPLDYIHFLKTNDPNYGAMKKKLSTFMKQRSRNAFGSKNGSMHSMSELVRTKWTDPFGVMKNEIAESAAMFHPDVSALRPAAPRQSPVPVTAPAQSSKSAAPTQPPKHGAPMQPVKSDAKDPSAKTAASESSGKPSAPVTPLRSKENLQTQ